MLQPNLPNIAVVAVEVTVVVRVVTNVEVAVVATVDEIVLLAVMV